MEKGDTVVVKPNFHRPSRIGQTAKIIALRKTGSKNILNQYFVVFDKDKQPDWISEYDLELTPSIQDMIDHDAVRFPIKVSGEMEGTVIPEKIAPFFNPPEEPQKRTLDL
jgi:hypothetical protein